MALGKLLTFVLMIDTKELAKLEGKTWKNCCGGVRVILIRVIYGNCLSLMPNYYAAQSWLCMPLDVYMKDFAVCCIRLD
jgi:hypothetical protein